MSDLEALEGKEFIIQYVKYNPYDGCVEIANIHPLVRCKDCKYFYEKQEECPFTWKDLLNDNDFCSYAERRKANDGRRTENPSDD